MGRNTADKKIKGKIDNMFSEITESMQKVRSGSRAALNSAAAMGKWKEAVVNAGLRRDVSSVSHSYTTILC